MAKRNLISPLTLISTIFFLGYAHHALGQNYYLGSNTPNNTYTVSGGIENYQNATIGVLAGATNNTLTIETGAEFRLNGTWPDGGMLRVGDGAGHNNVEINSGGKLSVWDIVLGEQLAASNNLLRASGLGAMINAHTTYIGSFGGYNSLQVNNAATLSTYDLYVGTGSVGNSALISGIGSAAEVSHNVYLGYANAATGSLTVANGGRLTTAQIQIGVDALGSGALNFGAVGSNDSSGVIEADIVFGSGGGVINFNQTNSFSFTNSVSGQGSFHQQGSGTTIIAGVAAHTGDTIVSAGSLLIEGEISFSDVSVSAGASIGGNGTVNGNLSLHSGAKFVFSLTETLSVGGSSVTFVDFGIDDLVGLDASTPNGTYTLIGGSAIIETNNLRNFGLDNAFTLSGSDKKAYFTEGSLEVTIVPEPSTYALLLLSGAAWFWALKRRKS